MIVLSAAPSRTVFFQLAGDEAASVQHAISEGEGLGRGRLELERHRVPLFGVLAVRVDVNFGKGPDGNGRKPKECLQICPLAQPRGEAELRHHHDGARRGVAGAE